jgi:hypothetical protein
VYSGWMSFPDLQRNAVSDTASCLKSRLRLSCKRRNLEVWVCCSNRSCSCSCMMQLGPRKTTSTNDKPQTTPALWAGWCLCFFCFLVPGVCLGNEPLKNRGGGRWVGPESSCQVAEFQASSRGPFLLWISIFTVDAHRFSLEAGGCAVWMAASFATAKPTLSSRTPLEAVRDAHDRPGFSSIGGIAAIFKKKQASQSTNQHALTTKPATTFRER